MMKKGQGMSLRVVIIAVLVLIVLVVLVLVFSGKLKFFGGKTTETSTQFDSSKNCKIPGTNNECVSSKMECDQMGGSYQEIYGGYADCTFGGTQCCYM